MKWILLALLIVLCVGGLFAIDWLEKRKRPRRYPVPVSLSLRRPQ